jgi:hypothetical protein
MNKPSFALALAALLGLAPLGHAEIGGLDDVPAATLLLPYFEVDLDEPQGLTTLFSVTNARQEATLVHLTLWTDLGLPTLDFNVYLTGYDIQTFNLRDLFTTGFTPQTASAGQDPSDTISNQGDFSLDANFASCAGQLPLPPLPATLLDHIRAAHTGQASAIVAGKCSAKNHGDNIARGYITFDQVKTCTLSFPTDDDYFTPEVLGFDNTLLGDYFFVDASQNYAQGENMVHLEADATLGSANYTFYRAFSGGADKREGLANAFLARFANGGGFDGGTDLIVWRDSKREIQPFDCGASLPAPFPLDHSQAVVFDEQENVEVPLADCLALFPAEVCGDFLPFPLQTNRLSAGNPDPLRPHLVTPFEFGAWYLNLNHNVTNSQVPFEPVAQAFVTTITSALSRFSVGFDAYQLSNVTNPADAILDPIEPPPTSATGANH